MSSKFFTWTKGDRRNATQALQSGGIVPIPAECLTIKGMDCGRSARGKSNRKPLPLPLNQQSYTTPPYSSRTSDSIALHDAAVQSATSLMAVMNDMLRSPQLSAHISSQRRSDITPMYARPRSHTAPSTPLVEAAAPEPAELLGSLPLDIKKPRLSLPYGTKSSSDTALVRSDDSAGFGASISQPHSSPQDRQGLPFFAGPRMRDSGQASYPSSLGAGEIPKPGSADPSLLCRPSEASYSSTSARATSSGSDFASIASSKRPSLSVVQPRRSVSPSFVGSAASSYGGSSTTLPGIGDVGDKEDTEGMLLDEMARLRASQDAHVHSLKEAHEKELACQRSYIAFLEKRRISAAQNPPQEQRLTIDTSHAGSRTELHSEPSATTLNSFESCFEDQRRVSQEAVAEVEALKRKLSLCRKAQVDAVDVRRDRDQLRDATDRSSRRILQLKDIIRKAKENEKALRNQVTDLEIRLASANNERVDVLEGFHDACSQVRAANERERRLAQDLDTLRDGENISCEFAKPTGANHGRTVSHASAMVATPPRMDPTMRQLVESRRSLAARDARIQELETATAGASERATELKIQVSDLERRLDQQEQQMCAAHSDAERYNSLLHNEFRRQARQTGQHADKRLPQIEAEALVVASEKMVRLRSCVGTKSGQGGFSDGTSAQLPAEASTAALATALEKELDHCIKEIIMYKLDIKGYRKDLKKANAEIDGLRAMSMQRPPTPDRDSMSNVRSQRGTNNTHAFRGRGEASEVQPQAPPTYDPGLGITLPQPPKTPTKQSSIAAATAAALSSPPLASPSHRTKTPFNTYKKLPKPPGASRSPSPLPSTARSKWPEQDIARTETLRSLSESIISSYAKRNQAEMDKNLAEPTSEPLGSFASPTTPVPGPTDDNIDNMHAA